MKNHKEMFEAFLAGETLASPSREYKMIAGKIHSLDLTEYGDGEWIELQKPPKYESVKVKPKTININGIEVPVPLRVAPEMGETYWIVEIGYINQDTVDYFEWDDDHEDRRALELGIIHPTKEAAQLHAQALLSFTRPEVKP